MTGLILLLYIAIGVGCGLIRLSAVAVGVIAMLPAAFGAYAFWGGGLASVVIAIVFPLLVIEGVYFVTLLVAGKFLTQTPPVGSAEARKAARGNLGLPRKMGKER